MLYPTAVTEKIQAIIAVVYTKANARNEYNFTLLYASGSHFLTNSSTAYPRCTVKKLKERRHRQNEMSQQADGTARLSQQTDRQWLYTKPDKHLLHKELTQTFKVV